MPAPRPQPRLWADGVRACTATATSLCAGQSRACWLLPSVALPLAQAGHINKPRHC